MKLDRDKKQMPFLKCWMRLPTSFNISSNISCLNMRRKLKKGFLNEQLHRHYQMMEIFDEMFKFVFSSTRNLGIHGMIKIGWGKRSTPGTALPNNKWGGGLQIKRGGYNQKTA